MRADPLTLARPESIPQSGFLAGQTGTAPREPAEIALAELVRRLQAIEHTTAVDEDRLPATHAFFSDLVASSVSTAPSTPASPRLRAVDRLRQMARWGPNWDGENSPAPDVAALDSAVVLLGLLSPFVSNVKVALDCFGKPMVFLSSDYGEGEITLTSDDQLEFVLGAGHGEADVGLHFDRAALPVKLVASMRAAGMI